MAKNLSCVSHGSLKRFPHTFTIPTLMGYSAMQDNNLSVTITSPLGILTTKTSYHSMVWG